MMAMQGPAEGQQVSHEKWCCDDGEGGQAPQPALPAPLQMAVPPTLPTGVGAGQQFIMHTPQPPTNERRCCQVWVGGAITRLELAVGRLGAAGGGAQAQRRLAVLGPKALRQLGAAFSSSNQVKPSLGPAIVGLCLADVRTQQTKHLPKPASPPGTRPPSSAAPGGGRSWVRAW